MDYLSAPTMFKLRKVARYVRLYGPIRTIAKVRGYAHLRRRYQAIPPTSRTFKPSHQVGLIGCGNFSFSTIAYYLKREFGDVIRACADIDPHRAASLSQHYRIPWHGTDASIVLQDPDVRLVFVASNHASHADYAIEALRHGKDVYIEKPHVTNYEELNRLLHAMRHSTGRVHLGFNRSSSSFTTTLVNQLARERGPAVFNWFVNGHDLPADHWYFREGEGGRILANLSHWIDYLHHLVGPTLFPVRIVPARGLRADANVAVSYLFDDGSLAVITFSEMAHAFEGVREHLRAQKGCLVATLEDFHSLEISVGHRRSRFRTFYRDHGHRSSIRRAYYSAIRREPHERESQMQYVANSAHLYLQTKLALDSGSERRVESFPAYEYTSSDPADRV